MEFKQKYYYYKSDNLRDFLKKYYQYNDISLYLSESCIGNRIYKDCYLYIDYHYDKHFGKYRIGLIKIWPTPPQFYKKENIVNVFNEKEFHKYFKSLVKIRYDLAKSGLEEFIKNTEFEKKHRKKGLQRLEDILEN